MKQLLDTVGAVVALLWSARKPIGAVVTALGIWSAASAFSGAMAEHKAATQALPGCIRAEMSPRTPDGNLKACIDRYTASELGLVNAGAELYKETLPLTLKMR